MSSEILLEPLKFYHVYNRGNNKENLFREDRNYGYFLNLWGKYIIPVAEAYAYCLLPNHFHFLIRVRREEDLPGFSKPGRSLPSQAFSNLFNAYTKSFNEVYERTGSLFQKNFKRKEITTENYFTQLIHYIHFNLQKHGIVTDFRQWPYSSYESILSKKPSKLSRDEVLEWFGGKEGYKEFHVGEPVVLKEEEFE